MPPKRRRSSVSGYRYPSRKRARRTYRQSRPTARARFAFARGGRRSSYRRRVQPVRCRGVVRRGRKRSVRRRRGPSRQFKMNLLKAEGQLYKFSRNVQSEFQVPFTLAAAGGGTNAEPMAQYMWPRTNSASEQLVPLGFMTPEDAVDIATMVPLVYGTTWYSSVVDEVFRTGWNIAYKARYQCTNMSNTETRYEVLVFRQVRDAPNTTASAFAASLINPLNVVGSQLKGGLDRTGVDFADARNTALHTERILLENQPSWRHYHKLLSKKKFVLGPGKTKTHYIGRKTRFVKMLEYFPDTIIGQPAAPTMLMYRRRGDKFLMYKALSSPADVNDTVIGLAAETTRTIPVSLLSYQCNYFIHKPNVRPASAYITLPTHGIKAVVGAADIVVMADDNVQEVVQRNVD